MKHFDSFVDSTRSQEPAVPAAQSVPGREMLIMVDGDTDSIEGAGRQHCHHPWIAWGNQGNGGETVALG